MNKFITISLLFFCLSGCVTTTGSYRVTAVSKEGASIPVVLNAHGANIYTARNAICVAHPGATISIIDLSTGRELSGESPYKCK